MLSIDDAQQNNRKDAKHYNENEHCYPVRQHEPESIAPILLAEISKTEIANAPRESHYCKERSGAHFESAGTKYRDLHRHGNGRQRGNENGQQTVSLKPVAQAQPRASRGLFRQHDVAALTSNCEQKIAADDGTDRRASRSHIRVVRLDSGDRNQQSIHSADDGKAQRVERGKQQESPRTPGNQRLKNGFQYYSEAADDSGAAFSIAKSAVSSITATPSAFALSSFEPASSPATT